MFARGLRDLVLLLLVLGPTLQAQVSNALQQTAPVREETSDDPLGRSTPRGTVLGFLKAADREDYDQAVSYLDTGQRGDLARDLARQLKVILDRETSIDLSKLSRQPEGSLQLQKPDRDLVGVATTSSGKAEVWLDRVRRGNNPPIWLFSRDTLRRLPEMYEDAGNAPEFDRYLPGWLKTRSFFSLPLWTLCVLLISIPLALLLGSLLARLLKRLLRALTYRLPPGTDINRVQVLVAPLRLTLFGVLFGIISAYSYTLLSRSFWRNLGKVLIIFGATWLLTRMIGIGSDLALARLKRRQASEKIALAGLLGRLLQISMLSIGALVVLYLAGVNLTAALTGLGIGGLALAFAAQKTLENLFGGIMIISDQPVRIGDVCKIGDVTGTVADIGLRSTRIRTPDRTIVTIPNGQLATMNLENYTLRDKFWFHPMVALRYETTVKQMEGVLREIRNLLDNHANIEPETARVRFISIGNASQDVEIFAYILAVDYGEFLGIQESLLLRILEIVESAGTALALPTQINRVVRESDTGPRGPKAKMAASAGQS